MKRILKKLFRKLDNQYARDIFVLNELKKITKGKSILDAGCGSQRYKDYCSHLRYFSQDFGKYKTDQKIMIGAKRKSLYQYGKLDYISDIWNIPEKKNSFDVILCTEVLEHIPYPNETIKEFYRILKPNGKLILTAPSNCLRHFDPFFFYTGFSDRWYRKILGQYGFKINTIVAVGDYYLWLAGIIANTANTHSFFSKIILAPAFLYFFYKKKTTESINALCIGYHVVATKKS